MGRGNTAASLKHPVVDLGVGGVIMTSNTQARLVPRVPAWQGASCTTSTKHSGERRKRPRSEIARERPSLAELADCALVVVQKLLH